MRIRLSLSLSITRTQQEDQGVVQIPPHDVVEGGAYIERAEPFPPLGFGPPEDSR